MQKEQISPRLVGLGPKKISKRILKGTVVSDKMDKTIVVSVERIKEHPRYRRRVKVSKKYKAHDPEKKYHVGDKVTIQECRPISKEKKWIAL